MSGPETTQEELGREIECLRRRVGELEREKAMDCRQADADRLRHESLFRTVVDNLVDPVFAKDTESRFIFANIACMHRLRAKSMDEVLGRTDFDFFAPQLASIYREEELRILETGERLIHREICYVGDDGEEHWYVATKVPLRDGQGAIVGLVGTGQDITLRKQVEQHLKGAKEQLEARVAERTRELTEANRLLEHELAERRRAERELSESVATNRALVDAIPDMILRYDREGKHLYYKHAKDFEPYVPSEEFLGRKVREVLPPEVADQIMATIERTLDTQTLQTLEYQLPRHGQVCHYEARMVACAQDQVFLMVRDITQRKQIEAAMHSYLGQIRKLTLDQEKGLEEQKAWISRELHDELGQLFTALNMNLAWLGEHAGDDDPRVQQRFREARDLVNHCVETVRHLSKSLRPPLLDHQYLSDAVRSFASEFQQRYGIACEVKTDPPSFEVSDPPGTTAFRIVQEALTNVARHARASRCRITLEQENGVLRVEVCDDGAGAPPERLTGACSLGILGMQERAAAVGGTLRVENRIEGGVRVVARLPCSQISEPQPHAAGAAHISS